jgi:hypothetical protein
MPNARKSKNSEKTLILIYQELSESWQFQQVAIKTAHNKSNWVAAFITAYMVSLLNYQKLNPNLLVILLILLSVSIYFIFKNYWTSKFGRSGDVEEMWSARNRIKPELLSAICEKKVEYIKLNNIEIKKLVKNLKKSIIWLSISLAILIISILINAPFMNSLDPKTPISTHSNQATSDDNTSPIFSPGMGDVQEMGISEYETQ